MASRSEFSLFPRATAGPLPTAGRGAAARLASIDMLRGFVMVIMVLDHVRETFFQHMQMSDPMDARMVMPALFLTRLVSNICAPVFVALTGLSAWLYGQKHSAGDTSIFLLKRGLFLLFLELTLVGFAWSGKIPPDTIWLQVIWILGLCMICLAGLLHLPRAALVAVGAAIVCGHNLLDPIRLAPGDAFYIPWAMLHQRAAFDVAGITVKTTYPLLPWIGVISLGYAVGPWFGGSVDAQVRRQRLIRLGLALLAAFVVLRTLNLYGDAPWYVVPGSAVRTAMSYFALTKYPPSLLFLLPTLGLGAILLAQFERMGSGRVSAWLSILGGAPMFFYLLHLYVLQIMYQIGVAIWGANHGRFFGVDSLGWIWAWYVVLLVALYFPTRWFSDLKKRRRDIGWLKYF
ncbi:DUF1624 domain-containing protein [Sphingobium sp.]|uniref:DUF1624 domain-containing protein n=1 Tax=Sphingobium sp. TaxID=1912891 RepID=UPI0035C72BB4